MRGTMAKNKLSILSDIRIEEPCHEAWEQMQGDQRKRHCSKCSKSVTNLSTMTKAQAERYIRRNLSNKICVRYNYNPRGGIKFKKGILQSAALAFATVLAILGISNNLMAESNQATESKPPVNNLEIMGLMAATTPTPTPTPVKSASDHHDQVVLGKMLVK